MKKKKVEVNEVEIVTEEEVKLFVKVFDRKVEELG